MIKTIRRVALIKTIRIIISCSLAVVLTTVTCVQARYVPQMPAGGSASAYPGAIFLAKSETSHPVVSGVKGLKMSRQELRIRIRALIRPTLGTIEESADRIISETSDPVVRRGALVIKIEMSTTMLAAMLRSDPELALADAWGYVFQCEAALSRPEITAKYGESVAKAAEMLDSLDGQFREFVSGIQPGPFAASLSASLRKWAEQHPIKGRLYRRPSMDSAVAKSLAESAPRGVFAAIGNLDETTADLMTRMDL